ncbi:hypothetical protein [Rickettsia amblyommatis]|uniref:Uncharacterized protein n=1 Tax=Rickettsia amblyommatis str. Ac/Pa TaxID=1359164 RepID=A0A0F3MZY0_RICAM|nr:hypothetical protein [Rickettsia amblyommatis]KJV61251.1 hypothetical protein APHACPA_0253 [Rickettsia amblyommatis str. Ac/Pa]
MKINGANNGLKEEMELSSDHSGVMLNLKPSNNEKEFKEKLEKIINTYEKGRKILKTQKPFLKKSKKN